LQPSARTSTFPRLAFRPGRSRERSSRPFLRFVLRRFGALILLALGITVVAFVLTSVVPGDPAAANLGQQAINDPAAVAAFNEHYGLDKPLPEQYGIYLWHLLHGDLGQSEQNHDAVTHDLAQAIPATAELALFSILVAVIVGVSLGVLAAVRRNKATDHVLRVVSLGGVSMPTFWIALVALYVFFFRLNWLPGTGRLDAVVLPPPHHTGLYTLDALLSGQWGTFGNAFRHLVLPGCVLAAYNIGLLTRYTRSAVLEVISNDYVRAARAKGLPARIVVPRHVLRAALPGIVTVIGLAFANVMTGSVLVEYVFSWPGIGQYAFHSATTLDLPAIMGVSLFVAVVYVVVNFLVDVLYGVLDARLRVQ
jgi:peptide/nickel transport system permease protein